MKDKIIIVETGKILDFADYTKYSKTFIETGTALGRTVQLVRQLGYNDIRSVEANEAYFKECAEMFKHNANVQLFLGMSTDKLPAMLEGLDDKPVVFWLDAHVSGERSAGYEDWLQKGNDSDYAQDKVLTAELDIILKRKQKDVIIIDDQNGVSSDVIRYANRIAEKDDNYIFLMYDELMGDRYYHKKILVALPVDIIYSFDANIQ